MKKLIIFTLIALTASISFAGDAGVMHSHNVNMVYSNHSTNIVDFDPIVKDITIATNKNMLVKGYQDWPNNELDYIGTGEFQDNEDHEYGFFTMNYWPTNIYSYPVTVTYSNNWVTMTNGYNDIDGNWIEYTWEVPDPEDPITTNLVTNTVHDGVDVQVDLVGKPDMTSVDWEVLCSTNLFVTPEQWVGREEMWCNFTRQAKIWRYTEPYDIQQLRIDKQRLGQTTWSNVKNYNSSPTIDQVKIVRYDRTYTTETYTWDNNLSSSVDRHNSAFQAYYHDGNGWHRWSTEVRINLTDTLRYTLVPLTIPATEVLIDTILN